MPWLQLSHIRLVFEINVLALSIEVDFSSSSSDLFFAIAMFNVDEGYCTIDLKDADKIPPLVLNMLIQLGPAVKYMALFTDVLMWKNPSASVLAVLLWITLCTWTQKWLVFGLPCLCFVKLASNWLSTSILRRRREASECSRASQLGQDLNVAKGIQPSKPVSMHDTVHHLQQIQTWWFSHCQWRHLSSYANQQVAHYLLIYIWPLWAALNFILGSHGIFALAGTWFLVASSPWYQLVLVALKNNPVLYHYTRALLDYSICLFTYLGQETHSSVKQRLIVVQPNCLPRLCHHPLKSPRKGIAVKFHCCLKSTKIK